jgi:predicted O-methyltransferase YrrM
MINCSGYGLAELLKDKINPVGLEIGCSEGDTSIFLLSSNPNLRLISIDPYVEYLDWNGNQLNDRPNLFHKTKERLSSYSNRFVLIRDYSDNAISQFENESLDFIFIDGLHTYEQVKKDCENYYSKIKPGGLFSGHDYNTIPAVNKAVNEFAFSVNRNIMTAQHDVWYWLK